MGAGWIAQGADTQAPAATPAQDPWKPVGPDTASVPALVRPHQDPAAHPVDNSIGLLQRSKELLFGHEPASPSDTDQRYVTGILPSLRQSVGEEADRFTSGPDVSTLATAYPHLVGAEFGKLKAGYQETTGAAQVQSAERQAAALNVLPQVAARMGADKGIVPSDQLAKDPLVQKTARSLGISPQEFAGDWSAISGLSPEQQADNAARAQATLEAGRDNVTAGRGTRNQAWADERVWQPSDLKNGKLDPWSAKGIAFNAALAIPDLAAVTGATVAGTAVGGPGVGMGAGAATATALFAPAQREDAKNKIDDQVSRILEKADQLDDAAPIGGKRGLNPVTNDLRQQAADLAASSDKIANTAGFLYAVGDAAGAIPVSAVLSRSPAGKAVLDRIVGAAVGQTAGGRIAGTMVANGAGGMLQASIQKAVDTGIVHEQTTLSDALKDIAYTGVTSAITAAPIAIAHDAMGAPERARAAQARRDLDADELLNRVKAASDAMGGPQMKPGQTYPGYEWNEDTHRYEPTSPGAGGAPRGTPRIGGGPGAAAPGAAPGPGGTGPAGGGAAAAGAEAPTGAAGARATYQAKVDALNTAAAAAEKRSDVTLEPEEEGWSVHVKGQPVAQFDTVEAARQAMAQARKVVGTKPAASETETPPSATKAPSGETKQGKPATFKDITETGERAPETELERTQPVAQVERRSATGLRQRVDQMTPEQMKAALLTHELTGIPNRRAYEDSAKKPSQVSVDVDSLKWINDNASHEGGDQLLKTVAQALHEESGGNAYHISGDEFVVQGDDHAAAEAAMARAKARLDGATLTFAHPDGRTIELKGVGLSHGTGTTLEEAEGNLNAAKQGRQAEGVRAARGEQPPNASIRAREAGLPAGGGAPAAEVLGQEVKRKPDVPTGPQAAAGNYFKPSVEWHGLPIKIENTKGQYRRFVDARTGKPGKRLMRADYGYIPGTKGADEDGIDIMMGPHADADKAYVIDQLNPKGEFDEHKVQVGVRNEAEARAQYLSHYPKDWKGLGGITELSPSQLKRWLKEGDLTKPIDPESVPRVTVKRSPGPDPHHDSILQFLARHPRGLDSEEAGSQGVDPADMRLAAAHVGIKRAFRAGGMSFDHAAEALAEAGYPVTDEHGHYSPNVLLDRIDDELRGKQHFSSHNDSRLPEAAKDWRTPLSDAELAKLSVDQAVARLEQLRQEQDRLEREIERAGLATEAESEEELDRIPFQRGGKPPGVQQDLFGAVDHVKNEIKKLEAALDKKRNTGQESVETGKPGDLFSQARQQTDLTDVPKTVTERLAAVEQQLGIKPTGALEDAGEKIGGARKDKWAERGMRLADLSSMSEGEAATLVNKKAVWNPNWQQLIDDGHSPKTLAMAKVLFDQLAAKPRMNTPEGRRHYVEIMGRVRDMMLAADTPEDIGKIGNALATELKMPRGYSIASTPEEKEARDKFWSIQKGRRSTLHIAYSDQRKADQLLAAGWPAKKVKEAAEPGAVVKDKGPPEPKRPHLDEINRIGPPVRTGDVTSTDFVKDLGFRGLEFGNWAANDERQRLLNYAYEGLQDLARIMNLPPKALSLNGTMGLALGARGGGRFAAHYEPGKLVINMTKINGAGALAHEWAHALDHYMGEFGRSDAYTTGARGASGWYADRRSLAHLRPEMQEAWNGVMEALFKRKVGAAEFIRDGELSLENMRARIDRIDEMLKTSPGDPALNNQRSFLNDVQIPDVRKRIEGARANPEGTFGERPTHYIRNAQALGEYWRRPTEMFARAFEGYVQDKIKAEGNQSDYLVQGAEGERYATGYKGNPYPLEDRPAINAAIQRLVDTFQTKQDGEKSVLYRRGEGGEIEPSMSTPEIRQTVDKFIGGFGVKPDVVIAKNLAELKRDPALASDLADKDPGDVIAFMHPETNKIYLVGDQFEGPEDVISSIAHEYITHYGLRAAFGDTRDARYQAILDGIRKAMPAEFRARGQSEFPGTFNPLNAHHRNRAAEEVLAYYGQRYAADQSVPAQAKRWLDRLMGMLRDWIRSVMGLPKKFDDLFVKRTLGDLESFLRRGTATQTKDGGPDAVPAFAGPEDTFYSGLAKAVDAAKRDKGTGAEWEATLRNMPGVKAEEIQWTGLKDWLEGRGRVTKDEVAEYVNAHRVQLGEELFGMGGKGADEHALRQWFLEHGEVDALDPSAMEDLNQAISRAMGGDEETIGEFESHGVPEKLMAPFYETNEPGEVTGMTQYSQWKTPGGENYRELLMKLDREAKTPFLTGPENGELTILYEKLLAKQALSPAMKQRYAELRARHDAYYAEQQKLRAQAYDSPHWDQKNVLAHVRFDDRVGPNGERVLHVHEVQSDWHQEGRRKGYVGEDTALKALQDKKADIERQIEETRAPLEWEEGEDLQSHQEGHEGVLYKAQTAQGEVTVLRGISEPGWMVMDEGSHRRSFNQEVIFPTAQDAMDAVGTHRAFLRTTPELREALARVNMDIRNESRSTGAPVPNAPFKTTWPELAMKRMLRYAAERGYDAVSWDTGETNAERYNLQNHVSKIGAIKHVHGGEKSNTYTVHIVNKAGGTIHNGEVQESALERLIGKEMAVKIANQPPGLPAVKYEGLDLKVGGEGMKSFYDKILPATVGKLVKKWGGKVEAGNLPVENSGRESQLTKLSEGLRRWQDSQNLPHEGAEEQYQRIMQSGTNEQRHFLANHVAALDAAQSLSPPVPAHMVRITPAMRDSVMAGQPMFLKRRKGSAGTEPPSPKKGAYALVRRAVAAIPNNEFTLSLRRIADPAGVSEPARATALVTREALGELAQASEAALQDLERYSKQFDLLGTQDRYDFIDAMEGGRPTRPDLQPAADTIRKLLDGWRENIRGLGVGALDNFIENYFPHIWQNDAQAKKIFGQIFGRRPLKGPASFLKERTIPTTKEGLEAGLTPISTNPLVLAFAKLREMQRFYAGVKLMQRFKDEGLAKFLPSGKLRPDDWAEINDAVGRVRQWSETEQGFIERGKYIMPVDAARVINNHLSSSALRNFLPAQIFRAMSNAANALQLGFSAFHLGFTTLDAVISKNALAIERLAHGEPLRAVAAFLEASTGIGGAAMNLIRGQRLMRAYVDPKTASPEMRRIVEGLSAAGGRVKMDNYFQAAQGLSPFKGVGFATLASDVKAALTKPRGEVESLTKVLTSFPQQYAMRLWRDLEQIWQLEPLKVLPIMSGLEIAGRMTRASTSIIMEHIVPLQKLGVFSDLAADHIRRNPLEDPVAFAGAMQRIWNSVDNRLGEMVYDNVFWNRTFKDVNHMMVRAVGWNLGTIRELGGAPIDVVKLLDYMARGAPAELPAAPLSKTSQARLDYEAQKSKLQRVAEKVGHKIPYTLALIGTTMIVGAIIQQLLTGKGPQELKDYFFPWTGRMTKYGTKERISMPSYTKDLYEYGTQPVTTLINKANPLFGILHSIYANEDFFGNAIRFPDDSWEKQTWQSLAYGARQVVPFSIQGTKQFVGAGEMDARGKVLSTMPYIGFGPAPARVTSPEQMDRYQMRETEKSYIRGLQMRLKKATEKGDKEEVEALRQEIRDSKLKERGTERDIRQDKIKAREAADKISSLIEGRSRDDAAAALRDAGMPAFAELWRSLPEQPRPRVVQSLEAFA